VTLEQLRVFVAVAERLHVTQAARVLNLAQSAASHAIAALESRHDTKLFDRVGRHIELTAAGRAFLVEARAVLARAETAELTLAEFGGLKRGTLSIEASQTIASYWLPRHLVAFRLAYPQIDIRLAVSNTAQVVAAVENRTTELGFVESAVHSEQLTRTPVARDQVLVVVGPDHPWAERTNLTAADILDGEWVLRELGSGTRSVFEDALVNVGVDPQALRVRLILPSNEAVRAAVEAGLGATVISASVAASSIEAGLLRQVDFRLPAREFYVISHRERSRSRAAEALLEMVAGSRATRVAGRQAERRGAGSNRP
jgi:DNA-binding transcriptional LysR family regulator